MRRGNQRIRKARAAKRRWLVAEHLTREGDAAGSLLMEVLIRRRQHRQAGCSRILVYVPLNLVQRLKQ